jgi:hypothetical protein
MLHPELSSRLRVMQAIHGFIVPRLGTDNHATGTSNDGVKRGRPIPVTKTKDWDLGGFCRVGPPMQLLQESKKA